MTDESIKKRAIHRIKIISGQVGGLLRAVEDDQYCIDILNQSLSVQKSLKSLNTLLLENHLRTCVKKNINKKSEGKTTIKELLKIYKLAQKK